MVFQKIPVLQNFSRISWVSQSCFLSGSVRLTVLIISGSHLGVSILVLQSKKSKSLSSQRKTLVLQSQIYHSPPLVLASRTCCYMTNNLGGALQDTGSQLLTSGCFPKLRQLFLYQPTACLLQRKQISFHINY